MRRNSIVTFHTILEDSETTCHGRTTQLYKTTAASSGFWLDIKGRDRKCQIYLTLIWSLDLPRIQILQIEYLGRKRKIEDNKARVTLTISDSDCYFSTSN